MSQKEHSGRADAHVELLSFAADDPANPTAWGTGKKMFVVLTGLLAISNSTVSSSLPSGALDYISADFHITGDVQPALPISLFLVGYILGPIIFAPLSETYGRKSVLVPCFVLYTAFTLGCALAPNWASLLVFRFFVGTAASAPYVIVGGVFADIYTDKLNRGRAITVLLACMNLGPVIGPIISGYASPKDWRWTFWISLIICGVSWPPLVCLPETYTPVLLARRARRMRAHNQRANVFAPSELEPRSLQETITVVLIRPIRLFSEPIILFTCLFLALLFAIYYLFFEAYPLIFKGVYGLDSGSASLTFLPIGIGAALDTIVFVWYDWYLARAKKLHRSWALDEEYRRLPLACIGAPLYVISLFWLGWTARSSIHWIVPVLSGLTFGIGIELTFMALLNYITDAYAPYAASAMASSSISRSLFAVVLPLATNPMYRRLGIPWASSLLGFLALALGTVPFIFLKYGAALRKRSKVCQRLAQEMQEDEETE
ncbi:Major facilitator superfamily [Macrophomina phaseolina MS6]|uniref:Major facilitator superfamily n=2 Tax=Macrophomina phaseolina TaxID=35725 RepID=K2RBU4_MACPH|nr:Major facilitator superfamily [Macrophomina phaseolina MS6]KAH7055534.1 major facilitator superfamily domain-containing protein [Macrophomina phaseolina]